MVESFAAVERLAVVIVIEVSVAEVIAAVEIVVEL